MQRWHERKERLTPSIEEEDVKIEDLDREEKMSSSDQGTTIEYDPYG